MTLQPEWVWGVDVAAGRIDLGLVRHDGAYRTDSMRVDPKLKGAARLAELYGLTRDYARFVAQAYPPLIVYVERPTGAFPNPALDHAAGVVQAALYEGLSSTFTYPVDVQLVAVSDWKKRVLGAGNASKQDIAQWATEVGYRGCQDGADALGIAACAAKECNFGPGPIHPLTAV